MGHAKFIGTQSVFCKFLGNQISPGDFKLLFGGVTVDDNDLHPIPQRGGDVPKIVGRGDEDRTAQVDVKI